MSDSLNTHQDADTQRRSHAQQEHPISDTAEQSSFDPLQPHNMRVSAVSGAPAQVSTDSPDVHVSLVQPAGLFKTPQTEHATIHARPSSRSATSAPAQQSTPAATEGYFASAAPSSHADEATDNGLPETAAHTALARQATHSSDALAPDESEPSLEHRLAAHRDSIAIASTQRRHGTGAEYQRHKPRRSLTEHPALTNKERKAYPEQSLAALSPDIYQDFYQGAHSSQRPRSPRPTGTDGMSRISSPNSAGEERYARTVGNTPIQTPGPFSPRVLRHSSTHAGDEDSPLSSPYLHPFQQAPKETNKAVRDLDSSSGRKTINQYEILNEIGKGAHGKVKRARDVATGQNFAIKIVQRFAKRRRLGKAAGQEDKVKKEVAILKKALHPNVVSMIEVIDDPDLHKIYLVLEFCEAHDVKWRCLGEGEIVLMEYRRLSREREGRLDVGSAMDSDNLARVARRRRERARQQRRTRLPRIGSESEFWSLEFADDSESGDDGPASPEAVSRVASSQSGHGDQDSVSGLDTSADISSGYSPAEHARSGDATPSSEMHNAEVDSSAHGSWDLGEFQAEMQRRLEDQADVQSGETRGRKPSLAESTSSMISDLVERNLAEDLRYVPLFTTTEARRAFRDALLGIEFLHYHGIIHRDIKPENLLRKADHSVKISDFGVSYLGKPIREGRESEETSDAEGAEAHEDETELAKTVGTPAFYAPELCDLGFTEDKPRVTGQIDVWALGVTLYCIIYARLPFQANNEFVMMRRIVEDDVFFSTKRLKAVDTHTRSRSGSHGPQFLVSKDHRLPHEFIWDYVDDELLDLLKRLLIKDPSQRITVKEIKTHPWVLRDISNPLKWLEDTDPNRFAQGRKIEITNQEIIEAVAPLRFVERAKSVVKKAIGGLAGLGGSSRRRGQSSAAGSEASSSPGALPPHGPQGAQQDPPRSDNSFTNPKSSKEQLYHHADHPEHPLSQSVTASPEMRAADEADDFSPEMRPNDGYELTRPPLPDRQGSVMSTAASVRTVRQADIGGVEHAFAPPALEQSMLPQEQYPGHILNMLGDAGRNILRTVRSRDRNAPEGRSPSNAPSPMSAESSEHLQGQPSVALSSTSASGHLTHGSASPVASGSKRSSVSSQSASRPHAHHDYERQLHQGAMNQTPSFLQLNSSSPNRNLHPVRPAVSSNSSDDHLNPAISSRETSFPSIPSVVSADSSVIPDTSSEASPKVSSKADMMPVRTVFRQTTSRMTPASSKPLSLTARDNPLYHEPEDNPETDEDDSDSDEGVLMMNRNKSRTGNTPKLSGRRSGSTNTVKKRISRDLTPLDADGEETPRGRQPSQIE